MRTVHRPVLLPETLDCLRIREDGVYVDGTVGEGGHAAAVLGKLGTRGLLLGLDRDERMLNRARERLSGVSKEFLLFQKPYDRLDEVFFLANVPRAHGILLDLGVSSAHLDDPDRGFSFRFDGPLDMRFDRSRTRTAADLVNDAEAAELLRIFREYGEERWASRMVRAVVLERRRTPIRTTAHLARVLAEAVPARFRKGSIHPATRVFQALRIAVNDELEHLERFLQRAPEWLEPEGRLAVIAYHSLEDRLVKHRMQDWSRDCVCPKSMPRCTCRGRRLFRLLTPKPLKPSAAEREANPRSRSARLRACERV